MRGQKDEGCQPAQHENDVAGCRQAWEGRVGWAAGRWRDPAHPVSRSDLPASADPAGSGAQGLTSFSLMFLS